MTSSDELIWAPLTAFLCKGKPKTLNWTSPTLHPFHDLKNALSSEPLLHAVQPGCPFTLFTDTSGHGIGVVWAQATSQGERPMQYLSHQSTQSETIQPSKRRLWLSSGQLKLCIVTCVCVWGGGIPFTVATDHAPLAWPQQMKDTNPRLSHWYLALQLYAFTIKHGKGWEHANVDFFFLARWFKSSWTKGPAWSGGGMPHPCFRGQLLPHGATFITCFRPRGGAPFFILGPGLQVEDQALGQRSDSIC